MAQFGLPGGGEWFVILTVIVLLFVPGVLVFGAGFLMGKQAGERRAQLSAEDVSADERETEQVDDDVSAAAEGANGMPVDGEPDA